MTTESSPTERATIPVPLTANGSRPLAETASHNTPRSVTTAISTARNTASAEKTANLSSHVETLSHLDAVTDLSNTLNNAILDGTTANLDPIAHLIVPGATPSQPNVEMDISTKGRSAMMERTTENPGQTATLRAKRPALQPALRPATPTRSSTSATSQRPASTPQAVATSAHAELVTAQVVSHPPTPSSSDLPSQDKNTECSLHQEYLATNCVLLHSQDQQAVKKYQCKGAVR